MSSSCAPPTLCDVLLCHVMCSHPPWAWDSHHVVVVVGVCQEVKLFQLFWGSSYDLVRFFIFVLFFVTISIQHCFRKLCLGNAAHPPTLPKKPTCFIFNSCTHTCKHTQESTPTHLPHPRPQPSIPYILRNPATHSFKPTHPLIPPSFFRFQLGRFNHEKQLGCIRSTRDGP